MKIVIALIVLCALGLLFAWAALRAGAKADEKIKEYQKLNDLKGKNV